MSAWTNMAFIQGLGGPELLIIFFVVLLLFGAKRLPELARGMGKAIHEFKKASSDIENDLKRAIDKKPEAKDSSETSTPPNEPKA